MKNKTIKKWRTFLIVLLSVVFVLAGCGGDWYGSDQFDDIKAYLARHGADFLLPDKALTEEVSRKLLGDFTFWGIVIKKGDPKSCDLHYRHSSVSYEVFITGKKKDGPCPLEFYDTTIEEDDRLKIVSREDCEVNYRAVIVVVLAENLGTRTNIVAIFEVDNMVYNVRIMDKSPSQNGCFENMDDTLIEECKSDILRIVESMLG